MDHHLQLCFHSVCVHLWCLGSLPFTLTFRVPMTTSMGPVSLQRRFGYTITALIAPELITRAMRQCFSSHQTTRHFKDSGYLKVKVSLSQPQEQPLILTKGASSVLVFPWCSCEVGQRLIQCQSNQKMLYIDIPESTLMPENQIHDKSKDDAISKGSIVLQVAWFVMRRLRIITGTRATITSKPPSSKWGSSLLQLSIFWPQAMPCGRTSLSTYGNVRVHIQCTRSKLEEYFDKQIWGLGSWFQSSA